MGPRLGISQGQLEIVRIVTSYIMKHRCPQRQILIKRVATATEGLSRLGGGNGENVRTLLEYARDAKRIAERELRAHVEKHGCTL